MSTPKIAPLLIAEDNDEDFEILRLSFEAVGFDRPIVRFEDGAPLLDYLFRRGEYADAAKSPRPALVLLDLNLPDTDGREVLIEIEKHAPLRDVPIIVLTTSDDPRDVTFCYEHSVTSYSIKPVGARHLGEFVRTFRDYWFSHTLLPDNRS